MNFARTMDKASGMFFFAGFFASKLKTLPFATFSLITYITSLSLFLLGYSFWLIACHFYPDHARLYGHWFALREFREQSKTSALLGLIGIIGCFTAFMFPPIILPALWLIVGSNIIWSVSQFHKMRNPPHYEEDFSSTRQSAYLNYVLIMTAVSLITALSATIAVMIPPIGATVLTLSAIYGFLVTLGAFYFWFECNLGEHQPDTLRNKSYKQMSLDLSLNHEPHLKLDTIKTKDEAVFFQPLFSSFEEKAKGKHIALEDQLGTTEPCKPPKL